MCTYSSNKTWQHHKHSRCDVNYRAEDVPRSTAYVVSGRHAWLRLGVIASSRSPTHADRKKGLTFFAMCDVNESSVAAKYIEGEHNTTVVPPVGDLYRYVCMYVWTYIQFFFYYIYTDIYIYINVCVCIHVHTHTHVCVCMWVCVHTTHTHIYIYIYISIYIYIYTYVNIIYIYTYICTYHIYKYIYIYIHLYVCMCTYNIL